jgi:hypothetical protein
MFRKITSLVAAVSFILLAQFADCMAMSADQQTMECCRTMSCNPANHSHDCCKKMVTAQTPSVLLISHTSFSPPLAIAVEAVPIARTGGITSVFRLRFEPPQHSPPLYTLHASLLI